MEERQNESHLIKYENWRSRDQCFWHPPAKAGLRDSSNLELSSKFQG